MPITATEIARIRLASQQLAQRSFTAPKDLVQYMGALQAQDFHMCKWAAGIRLPGSTDATVQDALDKGEILRTHVLRPTWHLVTAADIHWMLELTAPQIRSGMKSRHKQLELDEPVIKKSNKIIEKVLSGGEHLTRDQLATELEKGKIATKGDNRLAHILLHAEMDQLICSGVSKNKNQTYALLEARAPVKKHLKKDEALAELANRYFTSHGPATLQDFTWWSGLNVSNSKEALEMVKSSFFSETLDGKTYWFKDQVQPAEGSAYLLPAYDEFIISYKDRSASIAKEISPRAISINGIFRPVIVVDGQVTGIWKRTFKRDTVIVEPEFFFKPDASILKKSREALQAYGDFLNRKVII